MGFPTTFTFLVPGCVLALQNTHYFGFLGDHIKVLGKKKCGDKVVNISFSQESLDYCPLFVVRKPFGFLTANAQQGSSLTSTDPFSCADSAKNKKGVPGW